MAGDALGFYDEPQTSGAVVAVHYGKDEQEIWVRSGSNIGCWYCLGTEWGRPKIWDDPRTETQKLTWTGPAPKPGPGEIRRHPHWQDVLARGPVTLLTAGDQESYRTGWRNGRREMVHRMEAIEDEEDNS